MGMLSFIKEAGEKLFGKGKTQAAMAEAQADPASAEKQKAGNDAAADAIMDYIGAQGLKATGLTVTFESSHRTGCGPQGRAPRAQGAEDDESVVQG